MRLRNYVIIRLYDTEQAKILLGALQNKSEWQKDFEFYCFGKSIIDICVWRRDREWIMPDNAKEISAISIYTDKVLELIQDL